MEPEGHKSQVAESASCGTGDHGHTKRASTAGERGDKESGSFCTEGRVPVGVFKPVLEDP